MLHTDFGLVALGYSTDTQHDAYVPLRGETDAPEGLRAGLRLGNRLQDIVMEHARVGVTGNQALAAALARARAEGIEASTYCHAIGYHGHEAGPPIELNVTHAVPEWGGQRVRFALEEDARIQRQPQVRSALSAAHGRAVSHPDAPSQSRGASPMGAPGGMPGASGRADGS